MNLRPAVAAAWSAIALMATCVPAPAQTTPDLAEQALVKRGEYLAIAGDCAACHTPTGGRPYAGGVALATPVGDILSTNITPSKTHGIGNDNLLQFSDALRRGLDANGDHLYPAMPYAAYARITDDDVRALYAYFMHGVAPVDASPPRTRLPFPFDIRASMAVWNLLFLSRAPFRPDSGKGQEWNRGAYLVRGLAHCGACHSPRNLLMAEDASRELAGGTVGAWYAPNITSDVASGIGGWTVPEIVAYLRDGHAQGKAQAAGPMEEAIDHSLSQLSENDLNAIAVFIKTVPAVHDAADVRPRYDWGAATDDLATIRGVPLPNDPDRMSGPQVYDAWCATCHQAQGQGSFDGGMPPLFHDSTMGSRNSDDLVMVMLDGTQRGGAKPGVAMPSFAQLSDRQLAILGTWLATRYGNPDARVTEGQVRTLRGGGPSSNIVTITRVALAVVVGSILAVVWIFFPRKRGTSR